jgi:hypothetical protein
MIRVGTKIYPNTAKDKVQATLKPAPTEPASRPKSHRKEKLNAKELD